MSSEEFDVVIEDAEPEQTDNGVRSEDGDQTDIKRFVDAALSGAPIDEQEGE